jgi:hypothetical protein
MRRPNFEQIAAQPAIPFFTQESREPEGELLARVEELLREAAREISGERDRVLEEILQFLLEPATADSSRLIYHLLAEHYDSNPDQVSLLCVRVTVRSLSGR